MKRSRRICLAAGIVAVAALTIWALAGNFTSNGSVYPSEGWTGITDFRYEIRYILDPGEPPPDVYVRIYKDGIQVGGDRMMYIASIREVFVDYEYETKLYEEGEDYSFYFWTLWDDTHEQAGPEVNDY